MLTGVPPFSGSTPLAIALQHSAQPPRPPAELNSLIPAALEAVVLHALAKRPDERPPDAAAFNRELHQAARDSGLDDGFGFAAPTSEIKREDDGQSLRDGAPQTDSIARKSAPETVAYQATDTIGGNVAPAKFNTGNATAALAAPRRASSATRTAGEHTTVVQQAWQRVQHERSWQIGALAAVTLLVIVGSYFFLANRLDSALLTNNEATRGVADNAMNASGDNESIGRSLVTSRPEVNADAVVPTNEPQTAAEFYEQANYYFSTRDYARAASLYRRAVELQPDFSLAYNRLGWMLVLDGKFRNAAREFQRAIELRDGNFPAAHYNLGYALQRQGNDRRALEAYEEAINNRNGVYPDAHFQRGMIFLAQKRDADAADALTRAIEQNGGNDYDANFGLGVSLARQKKIEEAEAAFRRAIVQRNGFPDANYNLGLLYENNDRPDDAIREYEFYLEQQPNAFNRRLVENSLKRLKARQNS